MPSEADLLLAAIQQAHHEVLLELRSTTAGLVEDAWDAYADLGTAGAREFTAAAAAISDGARLQTAASAAAYLEANDAILGLGTSITPGAPMIRNGVPAVDVYQRSIIQARTMVANGTPVDTAMNAGKSRAASAARTDVIAANRQSVADMRRSHVVGYRRVLTGKSCAFCATASTQRYKRADLQPIHPSCDCDVAEIYGDADPGHVVNRQLLDDIKAESGTSNYWNDRSYVVGEDGEFYKAKTIYVKDPETGKRLLGPNGSPVRRIEAGDPLKVATKTHGELGPILTDSRQAFTAADEIADLELPTPPRQVATSTVDDVVRVADTTVDVVEEIPPKIVAEALEQAPTPRIKATDPTSRSVQKEAQRRNVSADIVAQERDAKKLEKALDARRARDYESSLSVDHPDVIRAATKNGVTPDEVLLARERVPEVRAQIRDAAARVRADEFERLYQWNETQMRGPGRFKGKRPAEYDFLERLDDREKARLSRKWFSTSVDASAPDQLAHAMQAADAALSDLQLDEVIDEWLRVNRRYEMSGAVRRGKLPSSRAYSNALDVDDLLSEISDQGISVRRVLSSDDLDVAGHIASADRATMADEAYQFLGNSSTNPIHGSRPYEMSFQRWEEEVRTLEYGLRNTPSEMPRSAAERLAELVPQFIDEPGLDYEELYARIVSTAQTAGEDVPSYARIPWQ